MEPFCFLNNCSVPQFHSIYSIIPVDEHRRSIVLRRRHITSKQMIAIKQDYEQDQSITSSIERDRSIVGWSFD